MDEPTYRVEMSEIVQEILHRFRGSGTVSALTWTMHAGVAEQADARDLKSLGSKGLCRFKSGLRHQSNQQLKASFSPGRGGVCEGVL